MSAWAAVVAMKPPMINLRRGTRSIRKNRQMVEPMTASTPLATLAISAALAEKPARVSSLGPGST